MSFPHRDGLLFQTTKGDGVVAPERVEGADSRARRWAAGPRARILTIEGPITRTDIHELCGRVATLLRKDRASFLVCDVARVGNVDAVTLDALARLQLTARRAGSGIRLRGVPDELRGLLDLTGLSGLLPPSVDLSVESQGHPE